MKSAAIVSAIAMAALVPLSAAAGPTVIDFEGLPGMTFWTGNPVPTSAQLSDQFLSTYGVRFASGNDYVAVVALGVGHATSGVNGISGTNGQGVLTYDRSNPIVASFFDLSDSTTAGVTDFVSVRGDFWGGGLDITLEAYDVNGVFLTSQTAADLGGTTLSVSAAGIHSVRFLGTNDFGGVGIDDFTFDAPVAAPVPEPETYAMMLAGLGFVGFVARRRKSA